MFNVVDRGSNTLKKLERSEMYWVSMFLSLNLLSTVYLSNCAYDKLKTIKWSALIKSLMRGMRVQDVGSVQKLLKRFRNLLLSNPNKFSAGQTFFFFHGIGSFEMAGRSSVEDWWWPKTKFRTWECIFSVWRTNLNFNWVLLPNLLLNARRWICKLELFTWHSLRVYSGYPLFFYPIDYSQRYVKLFVKFVG